MPVDRTNRTRAANALAAYLRGEIDNFKLDDETLGVRTRDKSLIKVSLAIWHCYDDIRRHSVRSSPEEWEFLTRCLAYLRSDVEEVSEYRDQPATAPFPNESLLQAHQHLIVPDNIPAYDNEKHAQKNYLDGFSYYLPGIVVSTGIVLFLIFRAGCRGSF